MPYFFVNRENIYKNIAVIDDNNDVNHITKSLRKSVGDKLVLCDGYYDYLSEIIEIDREKVVFRILDKKSNNREPDVDIILFQCLLKGEKMDLIIQKVTELGVNAFFPVVSKRVVVALKDKRDKKMERWNKISKEAQKSSFRPNPIKIHDVISIENIAKNQHLFDILIVPYEKEKKQMINKDILKGKSKIAILIGPEGGFEQDEIEIIKKEVNNVQIVSLGKRILRAETATLSTVSIVMHEVNEM